MSQAFGKLYTSAADALISAQGVTLNAARLYIWSLRHAKDGDKLPPFEASLLDEWMLSGGMDSLDPATVQVTQFSLMQASEVFKGSKTEAARQAGKLCECGIFERVGAPVRGHAQLYLVNPIRYTSLDAQDQEPKTERYASECVPKTEGYASECVPKETHEAQKGTHSTPNRYTSEGERVHISPQIGTHRAPVTCDVKTYTDIHRSNNTEGNTDAICVCPKCGSVKTEKNSAGLYCIECDAIVRT